MIQFSRAVVRRPGTSVVKGLRSGGGPDPDFAEVLREHDAYSAALESAGLAVTRLEPLEDFSDAVFVEDPALVFAEAAIMLRPGAPSRIGEAAHLRPALEPLFPQMFDLTEGFADGGDVLALPDRVLIGLSARTDRSGAGALAALLAHIGRKAEIVETPPSVLHLKSASAIIDQETVLATAELAATGLFAGYRVLIAPAGEERGANVLRVNQSVLVGDRYVRLQELLLQQGCTVVPLANRAIERIDAGLTCMSLRW